MGPHERLTPEAAEKLDGKIVPVTMEIGGKKVKVGEARFEVARDGLKFDAHISDSRVAELLTPDLAYLSAGHLPYRGPCNHEWFAQRAEPLPSIRVNSIKQTCCLPKGHHGDHMSSGRVTTPNTEGEQ